MDISIIALALALGAAAAFSVGPVFVTIMQTAVTHGFAPSVRVIVGSALADLLLLLPALAFSWIIATLTRAALWVSLAGALFLAYLAVGAGREAWRLWRGRLMIDPVPGWALRKGLIGNLASPTTWSFWLAAGTPAMLHAQRVGGSGGLVLFLVVWFVAGSGLEAALAYAVSRSRHVLGGRGMALLSGASAVFFVGLAVSLLQHAAGGRLAGQKAGASK